MMGISILYAAPANSSFSSDTAPGNTQQSISRPGAAVDGSYVTVEFNVAPPGTNLTATMSTVPSGWTLITSGVKTGSPTTQGFVYGKFMTTGDIGPWVWGYSLASNVVSQLYAYDGVDTTTPFADFGWLAQAASNTSRITPTIVLTADRFMRYGTHDRNASDPTVPSPDAASKLRNFQSASVSLVTASAGLITSGTSFTRTFTAAATTSVAGSYAFGLTPAASIPAVTGAITLALAVTGTASQAGIATGAVTFALAVTGTAIKVAVVTGSVTLALAVTGHVQTPTERWRALPEPKAAHRFGSVSWVECTADAAANAAAWSADLALEAPVWQTSDGVFVVSHDSSTDRMFGTTGNVSITTQTWASLSALRTTVGGFPLARLEQDILIPFATGNRVFFIDNKQNTTGSGNALLTLLASYGGGARFIAKGLGGGPGAQTFWLSQAITAGLSTWEYFYGADAAGFPTTGDLVTNQHYGTILGMDAVTDGTSTTMADALSYGKLTLAHIIANSTQKTTAAGWGATGYMVSGVTQVIAPDTPMVTGNVNLALAATGTATKVVVVTGSTTLALAVTGTASKVSIVTGSISLALAVTGTASQAGSVTGAVTLHLTVSGTATQVAVVTGAVLLALAVTGIALNPGNARDLTIVSIPGSPRWTSIPGTARWAAIPEVT